MTYQGVTTNVPVSLIYDADQMTEEEARAKFYRMLYAADEAGHFNGPMQVSFGEDYDPEPFTPVDTEYGDA